MGVEIRMKRILLTGIMKLRIAITVLFLIMIISITLSIITVTIENNDADDFVNSLTDDEIDQLVDIYSEYPSSDYNSLYAFSGWSMYVVTGMLFFLMVRVWKTDKIY